MEPRAKSTRPIKALSIFFIQRELNMRQRMWMELWRDYDCMIDYH